MVSKITSGVGISVETYYQAAYSNPAGSEYMFAYKIIIHNHNTYPIQLINRQWHIFDSNGVERTVEGAGVIGIQPILNPTEIYEYVSGCNLKTEMGKMYGNYNFKNLYNKKLFSVAIPQFEMIAPFKLN